MKYRALKSFSAVFSIEREDGEGMETRYLSMAIGEETEIEDQKLIDDLLKAGYIAPVREMSDDRGPLGDDEEKVKKKGGKKK